ncbi:sugar diacid recognition domain-containing protein [Pseudomonas typographi]|uniref:sugar diacid recognition domain-containing protein n=1 Tax=Pseudomonas typographi TaxID=2715964 RepID=UPI0016843133|nr:CdaR family transcriptional regulator [Pseudomonas typographi]
MFELDHALAQDIVDRAMAILPHNVNVMDSQGLILGSGEPERINTRHEGAQWVLANGRVVELDANAARRLKNVQPGVNLPLLLEQRLVGVLGITGAPDTVRTYAALVRMTAEMLLAQRSQQAQQQWRRQRRDDLQALLLGQPELSAECLAEAGQLGLKPHLARTPYALRVGPGQALHLLAEWLCNRYPDSWCTSPAPGHVLWCRPASLALDEERLLARLGGLGWPVLQWAQGENAAGLASLRQGCAQVNDVLAYGRQVLPGQRRLALATYRLPAMLWRLRDDPALRQWLAPLQGLVEHDRGGVLLATLRAWCAHNGQAQACADALGLHRNSLRYRLERIRGYTGLDPARMADLANLYLGVQLLPAAALSD